MSKKYSVAMVDDDDIVTPHYASALILAGHDLNVFSSVDDFEPTLSADSGRKFDLYIIDIMLSPGKRYSLEITDQGLMTGLFLVQDIRRRYKKAPIILLSNQTLRSVRESAERLSERLVDCISLNKAETQPDNLVSMVGKYFQEFELKPRSRKSIFRRIFNSLLLEPNLSGIGIDLKKLMDDE